MLRQVNAAIKATTPADDDAATVALAQEYARLIDHAAPAGKYAKALQWLAGVADAAEDEKSADHARTIVIALSQHTVASDLGPKLLAALDALLLSPRARAAAKKAVADAKPAANPLDQLAERRAGKSRAPAVDTGTP